MIKQQTLKLQPLSNHKSQAANRPEFVPKISTEQNCHKSAEQQQKLNKSRSKLYLTFSSKIEKRVSSNQKDQETALIKNVTQPLNFTELKSFGLQNTTNDRNIMENLLQNCLNPSSVITSRINKEDNVNVIYQAREESEEKIIPKFFSHEKDKNFNEQSTMIKIGKKGQIYRKKNKSETKITPIKKFQIPFTQPLHAYQSAGSNATKFENVGSLVESEENAATERRNRQSLYEKINPITVISQQKGRKHNYKYYFSNLQKTVKGGNLKLGGQSRPSSNKINYPKRRQCQKPILKEGHKYPPVSEQLKQTVKISHNSSTAILLTDNIVTFKNLNEINWQDPEKSKANMSNQQQFPQQALYDLQKNQYSQKSFGQIPLVNSQNILAQQNPSLENILSNKQITVALETLNNGLKSGTLFQQHFSFANSPREIITIKQKNQVYAESIWIQDPQSKRSEQQSFTNSKIDSLQNIQIDEVLGNSTTNIQIHQAIRSQKNPKQKAFTLEPIILKRILTGAQSTQSKVHIYIDRQNQSESSCRKYYASQRIQCAIPSHRDYEGEDKQFHSKNPSIQGSDYLMMKPRSQRLLKPSQSQKRQSIQKQEKQAQLMYSPSNSQRRQQRLVNIAFSNPQNKIASLNSRANTIVTKYDSSDKKSIVEVQESVILFQCSKRPELNNQLKTLTGFDMGDSESIVDRNSAYGDEPENIYNDTNVTNVKNGDHARNGTNGIYGNLALHSKGKLSINQIDNPSMFIRKRIIQDYASKYRGSMGQEMIRQYDGNLEESCERDGLSRTQTGKPDNSQIKKSYSIKQIQKTTTNDMSDSKTESGPSHKEDQDDFRLDDYHIKE